MLNRQRGISLFWAAIFSAAAAAVAVFALLSFRGERNLFADFAGKAAGKVSASEAKKALQSATDSVTGKDTRMKKCIIQGKTVISNVDCPDINKTTKLITITDGNVADAVKAPVQPPAEATSNPMVDKIIEKQLH